MYVRWIHLKSSRIKKKCQHKKPLESNQPSTIWGNFSTIKFHLLVLWLRFKFSGMCWRVWLDQSYVLRKTLVSHNAATGFPKPTSTHQLKTCQPDDGKKQSQFRSDAHFKTFKEQQEATIQRGIEKMECWNRDRKIV